MIRVIGIDPGTTKIGFGVIDFDEKNKNIVLVKYGLITLKESFSNEKIKKIYDIMVDINKEFRPDFVAIENQFLGKNVQTLLKLTHTKTAMMLAFMNHKKKIVIEEYPPATVKLAVTGKGNATKEELGGVINKILAIEIDAKHLDISDALGVALCHLNKIHSKFFL
ncbi:MAG: crossover junction endodeoxyribonuclease RuvC [Cytophagales bacterium]|jgi:crossover junction endodeoxyribonuclease RuvC|nr:crossover junction endodeoxyribonuclease RuvC [Cytophagales bacterium]